MVSDAASGNISWVCDPSLESYALEQPEMLGSHDYKHKCCAQKQCAPTVYSMVNSNERKTFFLSLEF